MEPRASRRRGCRRIAPPAPRADRPTRRGNIDRHQRHRLAARRAPAIPPACRGTRASSARPARAPNRDGCGSPIRRARRHERKPKLMRATQVLVRPAQPVGLRGGERIGERAADIGRAHHRMAAVEMGVHVDQHRPKLPAVQIDCIAGLAERAAGRHDARDLAALDQHDRRVPSRFAVLRRKRVRAREQASGTRALPIQ